MSLIRLPFLLAMYHVGMYLFLASFYYSIPPSNSPKIWGKTVQRGIHEAHPEEEYWPGQRGIPPFLPLLLKSVNLAPNGLFVCFIASALKGIQLFIWALG